MEGSCHDARAGIHLLRPLLHSRIVDGPFSNGHLLGNSWCLDLEGSEVFLGTHSRIDRNDGEPAQRFLANFSLAVLFAYSHRPGQNCLCVIFIAWPFLFLAGAMITSFEVAHPNMAAVVGVALFAQASWKSYNLNFVRYDDPKELYVYVQTVRDYHKFVDPILQKAAKDPNAKRKLYGAIFLSSCYPIPWVLGDFSRIAYYNREDVWPQDCDADFVVIDYVKADDLEKHLKNRYFIADFQLRDGMGDCHAYFGFETFREIFPNRKPEFDPAHPGK